MRMFQAAALTLVLACNGTETGDTADTADTGGVAVAPLAADGTWYGMTYAQRGADWWRLAFEHPVPDHPYLDATGEDCLEGLEDGVLYLGPLFSASGGPVERTCTVPAGTALYLSVLYGAVDSLIAPEGTAEGMIASLEAGIDGVSALHASIDGIAMGGDLAAWRAPASPYAFTVPEDSLHAYLGYDAVAGATVEGYAAGYGLMFDPLPAGTHLVKFGGAIEAQGYVADLTYTLTVQ